MNSFDSVDHNFLHIFEFKDLSREKLQAISSNPTFKVLQIKECQNIDELLSLLNNFAEIFTEALDFFFIDVNVLDNDCDGLTKADEEILNQIFPATRPWILQISSCDTKIYYKEFLFFVINQHFTKSKRLI